MCSRLTQVLTPVCLSQHTPVCAAQVNLLAVDTQNIVSFCPGGAWVVLEIMQLAVTLGALYLILGVAATGGLVVCVATLPLNLVVMRRVKILQDRLMRQKDERMALLSEAVGSIRTLKLHAWEQARRRLGPSHPTPPRSPCVLLEGCLPCLVSASQPLPCRTPLSPCRAAPQGFRRSDRCVAKRGGRHPPQVPGEEIPSETLAMSPRRSPGP